MGELLIHEVTSNCDLVTCVLQDGLSFPNVTLEENINSTGNVNRIITCLECLADTFQVKGRQLLVFTLRKGLLIQSLHNL